MSWCVYILECSDRSYYTGITQNIEQRIHQHNNSKVGAKYTKQRRPVKLAYVENVKDRSEALKREFAVKKLGRESKKRLISTYSGRVAQR